MPRSKKEIVMELILLSFKKNSPQTLDQLYGELFWGLPKGISISKTKLGSFLKKDKRIVKKGIFYHFYGGALADVEKMEAIISDSFGENFAEVILKRHLEKISRTKQTLTPEEFPGFLKELMRSLKGEDPKMTTVVSMLNTLRQEKTLLVEREAIKKYKPVAKPVRKKMEEKKGNQEKSHKTLILEMRWKKIERGEKFPDYERFGKIVRDLNKEIRIIPLMYIRITNSILRLRKKFSKREDLVEEYNQLATLARMDAKLTNIVVELERKVSLLLQLIEKGGSEKNIRETLNYIARVTALIGKANVQLTRTVLDMKKRMSEKTELEGELSELATFARINMKLTIIVRDMRKKILELGELLGKE